jgi:hypothetical protein
MSPCAMCASAAHSRIDMPTIHSLRIVPRGDSARTVLSLAHSLHPGTDRRSVSDLSSWIRERRPILFVLLSISTREAKVLKRPSPQLSSWGTSASGRRVRIRLFPRSCHCGATGGVDRDGSRMDELERMSRLHVPESNRIWRHDNSTPSQLRDLLYCIRII